MIADCPSVRLTCAAMDTMERKAKRRAQTCMALAMMKLRFPKLRVHVLVIQPWLAGGDL